MYLKIYLKYISQCHPPSRSLSPPYGPANSGSYCTEFSEPFPLFSPFLFLPPHTPNSNFPQKHSEYFFFLRFRSDNVIPLCNGFCCTQHQTAWPVVCYINQTFLTLQVHFVWFSLWLITLVFSEFLEYGNFFPTSELQYVLFFPLGEFFPCPIHYPTHLSLNPSSLERPFLASPYRNDLPHVFAIIVFVTLHLTTLFLSSFEVLWCFPAGEEW